MPSAEIRILIVEDNSDDQELLLRQLKKTGLGEKVRVIDNGKSALAFLESESHDLVALFLDLHLPGAGGLQILERLRAQDRLRHLPVVVMTSSNHPEDMENCRRLGVTSYVQKPVTYSSFSKAIADTFHSEKRPPGEHRQE